jgi:hypothetical protein
MTPRHMVGREARGPATICYDFCMAVRKPAPASKRSPRAPREEDLFDASKVEALILTPEQVEEQRVKLREWLDEWERELGPITDEDRASVERVWPASP